MDKVLITGTTSGLGRALAKTYTQAGYIVHSISRNKPDHQYFDVHRSCDLEKISEVEQSICLYCADKHYYKYVFLNAGILGDLKKITETSLQEYNESFLINVWANKIIIDNLLSYNSTEKIIAVSSGASSKGYFGWSQYCTTKASMRQLMNCYALEYPDVNFLSLAPGLIKTNMQSLIQTYNEEDIPSVKKFKDAYDVMQTPEECAEIIYDNIDSLSSGFFDLREIS